MLEQGKSTLPTKGAEVIDSQLSLKLLICSSEPQNAACGFIRLAAPLLFDSRLEFQWIDPSRIRSQIHWADAIIIQRVFPTPAGRSRRVLRKVYGSGKPILYEVDDYLFDLPVSNPNRVLFQKCRPFLLQAMSRAHHIVVSTNELGDSLPVNTPFSTIPNLLDDALWCKRSPITGESKITIGYAGSPTHEEDLAICEDALFRLHTKHGDQLRFLFMGCITERLKCLPGTTFIPFERDYLAYAKKLPDLGIDIGIAPLSDNIFNRSKSAIKWMELSSCGIPGAYSDLPPYREVTQGGKAGLLCAQNETSWFEALDRLVVDRTLRMTISDYAYQEVLSKHSLSKNAVANNDTLRKAIQIATERSIQNPPGFLTRLTALLP